MIGITNVVGGEAMEFAVREIKRWRFATWAYVGVLLVWAFYAWINLTAPVPTASFRGITFLSMELLRLTVVGPVLLIWMVALRGAIRFKGYARAIHESKDGRGMNLIATGLLLLVPYIVLLTMLGTIVTLLDETPYLNMAITTRNFVPVTIALIALACVYLGSERLNTVTGSRTWTRWSVLGVFLPFCILAVMFSWAFYTYFAPLNANGLPRFILSKDALMFTYVLPHLAGWLLGILAAINIVRYSKKSAGTIYRRSFRNLAAGMLAVLSSLIVVQLFGIAATAMSRLPLGYVAVLLYGLLVLCGGGFALIHRGAKNMERLETAGGRQETSAPATGTA